MEEEDESRHPRAVRLAVRVVDEEPDAPRPLENNLREDRDGEDQPLPALGALDAPPVSPSHGVNGITDHAVLVVIMIIEDVALKPLAVIFLGRQAPDGQGRSDSQGTNARERSEAVHTRQYVPEPPPVTENE